MATKRTVKRAKSAKRTSAPKVKKSGFSVQVRALESCLAADHAKLKKIYPKALSDVEKAIVRKVQELKKAKSQAKPAKGRKTGANLLKAKVALNTLEKAIDALKVEKTSLQAGHKRFTALHKANQQAEKIFVKNISKLTRKSKPKAKRRGAVRKTAVSESRAVLH